jgi:hypothetical protein
MPGNGRKFKREHDDNSLKPSLRGALATKQSILPLVLLDNGLIRFARNDG